MKIQDILKKQGEIYKDLPSNEAIQEHDGIFKKPPKLVPYIGKWISKKEHKAMIELEEILGVQPEIIDKIPFGFCKNFEIMIENKHVTCLRANYQYQYLTEIPEQINKLKNLKRLDLGCSKVTEIKNLDNLSNLEELCLWDNQISKIENLDKLTNLQKLSLKYNHIIEIEGLDKLQNLKELYLQGNKITKIENLDKLNNLKTVYLHGNLIKIKFWPFSKNRREIRKLRKKGIFVSIV